MQQQIGSNETTDTRKEEQDGIGQQEGTDKKPQSVSLLLKEEDKSISEFSFPHSSDFHSTCSFKQEHYMCLSGENHAWGLLVSIIILFVFPLD